MSKTTQIITVLSLIISLALLAISFSAYSRIVAPDLTRDIASLGQQNLGKDYDFVRSDLEVVEIELAANQNYHLASERVSEIRQDLSHSLKQSEVEVDLFGLTLERDLMNLEEQLRQSSTEAVHTIQIILTNFEGNLRSLKEDRSWIPTTHI